MGTDGLDREMDKADGILGDIKDKSDKDTSWGVTPSWFVSADCEPWQFGDFKGTSIRIDYCPAVPYAKGATSFIWLVASFFATLAMVGRTVGAGSRS